ncbi:MAG: hypothetical protein K9L88_00945 [Chromatiaceae bacterium]|nr:hypothetical protein [Chromatiaceae bacterium]
MDTSLARSFSPNRSLATWRTLGRRAFHTRPKHRCLPPPDDPAAIAAWSEGYRLAWCHWYDRLPTSPLDRRYFEADLQRALQGHHPGSGDDDACEHRPVGYLH